MRHTLFVTLAWVGFSVLAQAQQTLHVDGSSTGPGDGTAAQPYPTIQAATSAANHGDEILVEPGSYVENVTITGFNVALRSRAGAQVTKIIGNVGLGSPNYDTIVEGFSITGFVSLWESDLRRCIIQGTGLRCEAGVTVEHCVFTHCSLAIFVQGFAQGSVHVSRTILYQNTQNAEGPGMFDACCWNPGNWSMAGVPGFNVSPVTSDPLFFAPGDYHLSASSPCIAPDIGVFPFDAAYPTYASEECFGDGSLAACPCGNESAPLDRAGCRNATGAGGTLRANGSASLSTPGAILHGASMPEGPLLYFQGTSAAPAFAFGNGLKCTGGALIRLGILFNVGGASDFPAPLAPPLSTAGFVNTAGSRFYQARYRDVMSLCTGENFNYTNAVRIDWHD